MAGLTLETAEFVGIILESLLYGCYFILFLQSQHLLHFDSGTAYSRGRIILSIASVLLFLSTTAHFVIEVARLFDAFIKFRDVPGGPALYLGNIGNLKYVAKTASYVVQTCIGDALLMYRVFVLYRKKPWVMALPILMIGGLIACGIGITIECFRFPAQDGNISEFKIIGWVFRAWFIIALLSTLYNTLLIAFRIWSLERQSRTVTDNESRLRVSLISVLYLTPIIRIIVESAVPYCALLAFTLSAYIARSNIYFIGLDMASPTIGIVFTLIIVHLYNRRRESQSAFNEAPHALRGLDDTISPNTGTNREEPAGLKPNIGSSSDLDQSYGRYTISPGPWLDMSDENV